MTDIFRIDTGQILFKNGHGSQQVADSMHEAVTDMTTLGVISKTQRRSIMKRISSWRYQNYDPRDEDTSATLQS